MCTMEGALLVIIVFLAVVVLSFDLLTTKIIECLNRICRHFEKKNEKR